nr:hypothetical protein Iba_chr02bCG9220 [Ipomoea batatas]
MIRSSGHPDLPSTLWYAIALSVRDPGGSSKRRSFGRYSPPSARVAAPCEAGFHQFLPSTLWYAVALSVRDPGGSSKRRSFGRYSPPSARVAAPCEAGFHQYGDALIMFLYLLTPSSNVTDYKLCGPALDNQCLVALSEGDSESDNDFQWHHVRPRSCKV